MGEDKDQYLENLYGPPGIVVVDEGEPYPTRPGTPVYPKVASAFSWANLVVIPLTAALSVPPLVWFGHHWTIIGNDAARYLFAGSQLVSGQDLRTLSSIWHFNGGHGPVFPALIGSLTLIIGRDPEALAWAVRLLALLNPVLAYFLVKRISSPVAGLIAAALVTLFGYNVKATNPFNIDAVLLTFYLLALLALLAAIKRHSSPLALLSGLLLGASILTKETAFANLPLALLAVLLLGWELREPLWHYLGVVVVCLPGWTWAYSARGEVYLVDRLPASFQVPVVVAAAILLGFGAVAYASGMISRFLADERRRRWTGWFVVASWTLSLCGLLLATEAPALTTTSFETLRLYLAELLAPVIVVLPMLLLVGGYVIWKALGRNGAWKLLGLALLFQVPVCLLVVVEGWAPRQFLVSQTLLFCALAALTVDALTVAVGEVRSPQNGCPARLTAAAVFAASLVALLLASSVERVQALLPDNPTSGFSGQHGVAPQATEMIDWMTANVPEGKNILVTPALGKYLMFLDGGRHEWTFLRLDQGPCEPRPNIQIECEPAMNSVLRIPPDAVWAQVEPGCKAISLSMSNLLGQVRRTGSGYLMFTGTYKYPGILGLPSRLEDSNAFEVVHTELDNKGKSGANQGAVLLKSTGRAPSAVPAQMNGNTVQRLRRCEQAKGPRYAERAHLRESSQPYETWRRRVSSDAEMRLVNVGKSKPTPSREASQGTSDAPQEPAVGAGCPGPRRAVRSLQRFLSV